MLTSRSDWIEKKTSEREREQDFRKGKTTDAFAFLSTT